MSFGIPVRNGLSVSLVSSTFLSSGRRLNPALNLDFLTGGPLDPRITFSRTSQATLVDSTGKLTYAPNNLLTNSQDFEASGWAKGAGYNSAISANSTTSPTGATDADTLVADNAGGTGTVVLARSVSVTAGISYVLSFYAKKNTLSWMQLFLLSYTTPANGGAFFDLNSGSVGTVNAGFTATMTSAGNGWYRCAIAFTAGLTTTGEMRVYLASANNNTTVNRNGTDSIFIWGAQLEQVTYQTTPGTYNSTSPKNLLGYTQEFDNAAWTKSNAFVQTNLLTYSEAFDNAAWAKGAAGTGIAPVVTANAATAPDGTTTADLVVFDRGAGNALADRSTLSQAPTVANATAYSHSIYLKAATAGDVGKQIAFRGVAGGGYQVVTLTSSWVRVNITETSISTTGNFELATRGTITTSNQVSVHLWGAQLVQGSTAGDYQRTDAAAAAVQYVAPDGSRTADKLVENTANSTHIAFQTQTTVANTRYVQSVYAKAGERNWVWMTEANNVTAQAYFDLANGVVGTVTGTGSPAATITPMGNGWYRCSLAFTPISTSSNVQVRLATGDLAGTYTGDGTSGIYIWGAQLSNSASLDPYVYNPVAAPTSAAYYGPRFDYDPVTLANKGLLIEEQRTNLLTYSQEFDSALWPKINATITANAIVAPDGTITADKIVPNNGVVGYTYRSTGVSSGSATFSIYVKAAEWGFVRILFGASWSPNSATYIRLSDGAVTSGSGFTAQSVGNGWFRITGFSTYSTTGDNSIYVIPTNSGTSETTGNGTSGIYLWGGQMEAGSFATSYIPTVASQVTRTADVALMQGANFSNWYNQNEGSFVIDVDSATTGYRTNLQVDDGTLNNRILIQTNNVATAQQYYVVVGGSAVVNTAAQPYSPAGSKTSATYKLNDYAYSVNGTAVTTDTSATVPAVNRMFLGTEVSSNYLNGHIRRIGYYPTRLANAQLQSLTAQSTIPSLSLDFTTQVFNVG